MASRKENGRRRGACAREAAAASRAGLSDLQEAVAVTVSLHPGKGRRQEMAARDRSLFGREFIEKSACACARECPDPGRI